MLATATYTASDPAVTRPPFAPRMSSGGRFSRRVSGKGDAHRSPYAMDAARARESAPDFPLNNSSPIGSLYLFLRPNTGPTTRLGIEFSSRQIALGSPGQTVSWRSFGACHWAGMSMSIEDFVRCSHTLIGRELAPPTFNAS